MNEVDCVCVGAGVAGLGFATLLAERTGADVVLVETRPPAPVSPGDQRTLAIGEGVRRVLARAGAWQRIAPGACGAMSAMRVWEPGGAAIEFDAGDIGVPALAWVLRTAVLEQALGEVAAAQAGVRWERPARLAAVQPAGERVEVTLDNGSVYAARCLVGADGAESEVRRQAGIGYERRDYEQLAVFGVVATAAEHGEVARQVFLPSGPLAFLPLAGARECAVVWSTSPGEAAALAEMREDAFAERLAAAGEGCLGAITAVRGRAVAPLFRAEAQRYVGNGIALVGDAAHAVHPMAGQGANLGILDAAALVDCFGGDDTPARFACDARRLRRYERWRRTENRLMAEVLEALHWLFHRQGAPVAPVRRLGLRLTDRLGPVKQQLMRHASALAGDLPSAARPEQD